MSTSGYLIPWVVGQPVAVGIDGDHDDTRLAASPFVPECIAQHPEVAQPLPVLDRMVESHHHISAPAAEGDQPAVVVPDGLQDFPVHCLLCVAFLIEGHSIDKLTGSRHIFEYFGDVGSCVLSGLFLTAGCQDYGHKPRRINYRMSHGVV